MNLERHPAEHIRSNSGTFTPRAVVASGIGVFLIWYSCWTVICNLAVLSGMHYDTVFPQALAVPTLLALVCWRPIANHARRNYGVEIAPELPGTWHSDFTTALLVALSGLILFIAAMTYLNSVSLAAYRTLLGPAIIVATSVAVGFVIARRKALIHTESVNEGWGRFVALVLIFIVVYYLGHRQDEDESFYLNMVLGAQRSLGSLFLYDTLSGDGPRQIMMPTYRIHTFELLFGTIADLFNVAPIYVSHLLLPLPLIVLIAGIYWLILDGIMGARWFVASLFVPAIMMFNTQHYWAWGLHGFVRLFEGKALLLSAIVPLIAALTVRCLARRDRTDCFALGLAQCCAVGLSANGVFVGPFASGFVALAYLVASPRLAMLRRVFALVPTLLYPILAALAILALGYTQPSEMQDEGEAAVYLFAVTGHGLVGIVLLALLMCFGITTHHTSIHRAAVAYMPAALAVTLNPVSWAAISAFTGMLGFRIFWAVPAPLMIAALITVIFMRIGIRSEVKLVALALAAIIAGGIFNAAVSPPGLRIYWHAPTLKVNREDYNDATLLASMADPRCTVLAPERISLWIATIPNAPYPVFTRRLYLDMYRFTMPTAEREARIRLADMVDKGSPAEPADIARLPIAVGTIAVFRNPDTARSAAQLARSLDMGPPRVAGNMLVWRRSC